MAQEKCTNCEYKSFECLEIERRERSHGSLTSHWRRDTLCWCCKHVVPSKDGTRGCDWSRHAKPIPGWEADKGFRDGHVAYHVHRCPLFERG